MITITDYIDKTYRAYNLLVKEPRHFQVLRTVWNLFRVISVIVLVIFSVFYETPGGSKLLASRQFWVFRNWTVYVLCGMST